MKNRIILFFVLLAAFYLLITGLAFNTAVVVEFVTGKRTFFMPTVISICGAALCSFIVIKRFKEVSFN